MCSGVVTAIFDINMSDAGSRGVVSPRRIARMQSLYRKFTRERIARRKAGGGYDARSTRGLQALGFSDHSLPHHPHNEFLKKILLCDLPIAYHTKPAGVNAFHVSAQLGNLQVLENIISLGVSTKTVISRGKIDPRRRTKDGMSALHFAALADTDNPQIMKRVLEAILKTAPRGEFLLPDTLPVLTQPQRLVAQVVLQQAHSGLNVLGYCALSGNRKMMLYLLREMGCGNPSLYQDTEVLDREEARAENLLCADWMVMAKYSLEMNVTSDGALQRLQHIVCYNADADTLQMLLDHGITITGATDADGKNVFHHLAGSWRASASERLSRTFGILKLQMRNKCGESNQADDIVRMRTATEGQTPLHLACSAGTTDIAKMLLEESGGYACVTERDASGATPVMLLLRHRFKAKKQMELLKCLISTPSSRDTWWSDHMCGKSGQSLAIKACEWRNMVALRIVLDAEGTGPVDHADHEGKTSLHHCCEFGWKAGIETLLLYGASLDAQDSEGSTPLMLAIGANDLKTVDFLLDVARSRDRIEKEAYKRQTEAGEEESEKVETDVGETKMLKEEKEQCRNGSPSTKTEPPTHLLNLISRHRNSNGLSCILLSAIMPTTKMLRRMMVAAEECGCHLGGLVSTQGNNILHCAAAGGSADVVRLIEQYDLNLALHLARQRNEKAKLPKHIAKYWKHYDALTALMDLEIGMNLPKSRFAQARGARKKRA